jgi:hypothetical protein
MEHDELMKFIKSASPDQFIALRNKISELNDITFEEFVISLDNLIDLII